MPVRLEDLRVFRQAYPFRKAYPEKLSQIANPTKETKREVPVCTTVHGVSENERRLICVPEQSMRILVSFLIIEPRWASRATGVGRHGSKWLTRIRLIIRVATKLENGTLLLDHRCDASFRD